MNTLRCGTSDSKSPCQSVDRQQQLFRAEMVAYTPIVRGSQLFNFNVRLTHSQSNLFKRSFALDIRTRFGKSARSGNFDH